MAAHIPVESSWRMVEGANESFDTSVVPASFPHENSGTSLDNSGSVATESDPSSQFPPLPSLHSLPGRDNSAGNSFAASESAGGSQDDDLHAFLRKAEDDERVLLRSPFQPSLPSSVRQSPRTASAKDSQLFDRDAYDTPEPDFRMPVIGAYGSVHEGDTVADSLAEYNIRRRGGFYGADPMGSPLQKQGRAQGSSSTSAPRISAASAWRRPVLLSILGLVAVCGAVVGRSHGPLFTTTQLCSAASTVCSIPGIANLGLAACSSGVPNDDAIDVHTGWETESPSTEDNDRRSLSLVRCAGDLMRDQLQLAAVVRSHILPSRYRNAAPAADDATQVLPAHDAWRVPRMRTNDLLVAAQMEQSDTGAILLLVELEAYLDAARRVSAALSDLQTGAAATAADTLAYSTRRTLAQLRRIYEHVKASRISSDNDNDSRSWLARLVSSSDAYASAGRRRELLADAYRHHATTLLAKTRERVRAAEAVLHELEAAGRHLGRVQHYVGARVGGGGNDVTTTTTTGSTLAVHNESRSPFSVAWLWSWLGPDWDDGDDHDHDKSANDGTTTSSTAQVDSRQSRHWAGYASQLATLQHEHDVSVRQTVNVLDELAEVCDALAQLQARMAGDGAFTTDEQDLDMQLHMDIVEAGLADLEAM